MTFYQKVAALGFQLFSRKTVFKYGFNWSPMYRRSSARIIDVSDDLMSIKIKLPLSYKNRNYVGSIFGGSMFAAVDPIPMTQLMQLLGDDYVVWDKAAQISFKKPARETIYAQFSYIKEEIEQIKNRVAIEKEIELSKFTHLTNTSGDTTYCIVDKTIYVAEKSFYKNKLKLRAQKA